MSITVAELRAWLDCQSSDDVLAMGPRSMLYVIGPTRPPSIDIGLEHEEDCDHADCYPIDRGEDDDNDMRCRSCGFEWESGCLDEEDEDEESA